MENYAPTILKANQFPDPKIAINLPLALAVLIRLEAVNFIAELRS